MTPAPLSRPAVRVRPLEYGRPAGREAATNTLYHQAAKAAWVAPLIAIMLGCLTSTIREANPTIAIVIGVTNGLIILAGFVMAIVAFLGVKRYGPAGIIAPAIVGLLINLVFIGGFASFFFYTRSRMVARTSAYRAAAARVVTPFSSPQSSLRQTGWLGAATFRPADVTITLVWMQDSHADTRAERSTLKNDASIIVVAINNREGVAPAVLDTRNAQLVFADGRNVRALDAAAVLHPADAASTSPPFIVAPGGLVEGKVIFIPPDLDLTKLELIRVTLSGTKVEIPGRIYTAEEKTRMIEGSQPK
jgi:hypothetical protein